MLRAASYLTKQARGGWLLPFVTAASTTQALALGKAGLPLAMPHVAAAADASPGAGASGGGTASAAATAEAAALAMVTSYAPMLDNMLGQHWEGVEQCSHRNPQTHKCDANRTIWRQTIDSGARKRLI
eukprot:COSAG06_NODE_24249_length_668_cov_1.075571_1_plen_128_part_00